MKLYKISIIALSALMLTTACNDIDEQVPEGLTLTKEQSQETNTAIPERVQATFTGMFTMMGKPRTAYPSSSRADDFGFVMAAISLDIEGADMFMQDNNYNWFSVCGEYSSRNANYANPYIRYVIPYRQIGIANEVIASYPEDTTDPDAINKIAQARAMRAFDYMALAPYFQFNYQTSKDKPCVPILSAGVDYANNPRATVEEVWAYVMEDLNFAIDNLTEERSSKDQININVAYGLRARANLAMGNYAEAAADAAKAMEGYTPYSIAEVSVPTFYDLADHNWIWGISITPEIAEVFKYGTSASWINAFSGYSYSAGTMNTPCINTLLWNKIPDTDVRKGWWLDGNRHSDHWANLTWTDPTSGASATGDAMADFTYDDKMEFLPYTNIKFGMKEGVGSIVNNNDWPLMRVEEMILIQVEGLAKSGNEAQARSILENFVKTYRDPAYSSTDRGLSFADEIWFQRRVELWGEGFFMFDAKRLGKPVVRTHGAGTTNQPDAFAFNIAADDGWLNMRFPQTEMDNNIGIVDNDGGEIPKAGQNATLRDGVTD
ncbi:MAG: RagB/SusD family nutrient uptake outer membrane protein [Prevotella sp.]|nr:RagB/SusD family nutrient uptake outer membrane protein [Prevotella sp.]